MAPKQWVGIDVFGKGLEAFVRPIQRMLKVANSPAGLATLVSELLAIDPALIVVEATANWHLATVAAECFLHTWRCAGNSVERCRLFLCTHR